MMATKALATSSKRASASAGPLNWKLSVRIWTLSGCNGNNYGSNSNIHLYKAKLGTLGGLSNTTISFWAHPTLYETPEVWGLLWVIDSCCMLLSYLLSPSAALFRDCTRMMTHPGLAASLRARFAISTSERRQPVRSLGDCGSLGHGDGYAAPAAASFSSTGWTFGTEVSWCHLSQFAIFIKSSLWSSHARASTIPFTESGPAQDSMLQQIKHRVHDLIMTC